MAPSRGLTLLFSPRNHQLNLLTTSPKRFSSSLTNRIKSSPLQIYISRSLSPTLNLSLEHHLLLSTPPTSRILFVYANTPSIIIGRNQNPWTEVSLSSLSTLSPTGEGKERGFELVRRRSGGGTVMHDEGNVNYSVIVPSEEFDRDKHAVMVKRALEGLGVEGVRVNCRHDIVVDVSSSTPPSYAASKRDGEEKETAPAPIPKEAPGCELKKGPEHGKNTFKISGSAYKLTRLRSLHHGTCLLSSPNLKTASKLLTSPGKPFFKARGVESVRSPIMNVGVENEEFERGVVEEFRRLYEGNGGDVDVAYVPEVKKGVEEMRSGDWIWGQTPQFTFDSEVEGSELTKQLPKGVSRLSITPNSSPTTYPESILNPSKSSKQNSQSATEP
jgi:lipoate-protein ligase A